MTRKQDKDASLTSLEAVLMEMKMFNSTQLPQKYKSKYLQLHSKYDLRI